MAKLLRVGESIFKCNFTSTRRVQTSSSFKNYKIKPTSSSNNLKLSNFNSNFNFKRQFSIGTSGPKPTPNDVKSLDKDYSDVASSGQMTSKYLENVKRELEAEIQRDPELSKAVSETKRIFQFLQSEESQSDIKSYLEEEESLEKAKSELKKILDEKRTELLALKNAQRSRVSEYESKFAKDLDLQILRQEVAEDRGDWLVDAGPNQKGEAALQNAVAATSNNTEDGDEVSNEGLDVDDVVSALVGGEELTAEELQELSKSNEVKKELLRSYEALLQLSTAREELDELIATTKHMEANNMINAEAEDEDESKKTRALDEVMEVKMDDVYAEFQTKLRNKDKLINFEENSRGLSMRDNLREYIKVVQSYEGLSEEEKLKDVQNYATKLKSQFKKMNETRRGIKALLQEYNPEDPFKKLRQTIEDEEARQAQILNQFKNMGQKQKKESKAVEKVAASH